MSDEEILDWLAEDRKAVNIFWSGHKCVVQRPRDGDTAKGDSLRSALELARERLFPEHHGPDRDYVRVPAVGQKVAATTGGLKGHHGTVIEVIYNRASAYLVVSYCSGAVQSYDRNDVDAVGPNPRFVLIPK